MHSLICRFTQSCVRAEIVNNEDAEWFSYGLEKRITSFVNAALFLAIGIALSDIAIVVPFLLSFYFLRVRTNGYHMNSFAGCLMLSVALELLFLLGVLPVLNSALVYIILSADWIITFSLAPFNHENMRLDKLEFVVCKKSARVRISLLTVTAALLCTIGEAKVCKGITLGNTMAALLLVIANIKEKRRNENEKRQRRK